MSSPYRPSPMSSSSSSVIDSFVNVALDASTVNLVPTLRATYESIWSLDHLTLQDNHRTTFKRSAESHTKRPSFITRINRQDIQRNTSRTTTHIYQINQHTTTQTKHILAMLLPLNSKLIKEWNGQTRTTKQ